MNKVDVVDQYYRVYWFDRWCRNHKWWIALWFLQYSNINCNAFMIYQIANIKVLQTCNNNK